MALLRGEIDSRDLWTEGSSELLLSQLNDFSFDSQTTLTSLDGGGGGVTALSTNSGIVPLASGIEVTVNSTSELLAALNNAAGGDTIILTAGNYDDLSLDGVNFATDVTIRSLDPLGAVFSTISVSASSHIVFDGIHIEHIRTASEFEHTIAFRIVNSNNITIMNSELNGSVDGNYGNDVNLLRVDQAQDIALIDSVLHDGTRGAVFKNVDRLDVIGNDFFDIRADGSDFVAVRDVLIEANSYTSFHPVAGDHPDAIQFWSDNATFDSSNVVIRGNTILQGQGDHFQSIFISDANFGGYSNFTIVENVIYNGSGHGISVTDGHDFLIASNTVLHFPNSNNPPSILFSGATGNVVIENNIALNINASGSVTPILNGNLIVQETNSGEWNYITNVLEDPLAAATATRDSFQILPGQSPDGSIDFQDVGAQTFGADVGNPPPDTGGDVVNFTSVFASLLALSVERAAADGVQTTQALTDIQPQSLEISTESLSVEPDPFSDFDGFYSHFSSSDFIFAY